MARNLESLQRMMESEGEIINRCERKGLLLSVEKSFDRYLFRAIEQETLNSVCASRLSLGEAIAIYAYISSGCSVKMTQRSHSDRLSAMSKMAIENEESGSEAVIKKFTDQWTDEDVRHTFFVLHKVVISYPEDRGVRVQPFYFPEEWMAQQFIERQRLSAPGDS